MTRVAILSDIHGNAAAFDVAFSAVERMGFDQLVLLGDWLTYGPDHDSVLNRAEKLSQRSGTTLIEGNHDRLYRDLIRGDTGYYDSLPSWLRESVDSVRAATDTARLSHLPFVPELAIDGVLFAHANPYGPPDWSYLNGIAAHARAATTVATRGFRMGVFGHTHRPAYSVHQSVRSRLTSGRSVNDFRVRPHDGTAILDAGSVGQPRGGAPDATFVIMDIASDAVSGSFSRVAYDIAPMREKIVASTMSPATIRRLLRYLP